MPDYEARNLKEQFVEIRHLQDFSVIPLLDRIMDKLVIDIKNDPSKYAASSFDIEKSQDDLKIVFKLAVNRKSVKMIFHRTNLDALNENNVWWMTYKMKIEGEEETCKIFLERIKDFIAKQKLNNLKAEAVEKLRKWKTYRLNGEMYNFYLDI